MQDCAGERTVTVMGRVMSRNAFVARLFYLAFFASFGSLFPLLAVYFKQLGMTAAQAGALLGCRPAIEFIAQPFWASFASRFRKEKLLLLFSLGSLVIFTLGIGFVQPVTPFCVVLVPNNETCPAALAPAGKVVRGGALGMIGKAAGIGRRRRQAPQIIDKIVDLSQFDKEEETVAGIAPEYITKDKVCNYDENELGILVSPPHSTRVYRQPAVEQAFMMLFLLVALGEFFSGPALTLADSAVLNMLGEGGSKEFGKIRLFGSVGWGLAMLLMGIGLDYSDTFRNHPCPTTLTVEKNYTLCFVMCNVFMIAAMLIATQLKFGAHATAVGEVASAVTDSRTEEIGHAVAEKARARAVQADPAAATHPLLLAAKSLASVHVILYLVQVTVIGIGAGLVFAFLYWHLQDLGGSPVLFGILSVVNHATEITAYFFTLQIINKWGHVKVMYMCLCANVFRFLVLPLLDNPWMVLPLQVLQGFVLGTAWTCASTYISLLAPPQVKASAQTLAHFAYHCVGKCIGSIGGGIVIANIGSRMAFVLYAVLCLVTFAACYALNKITKYEGIKYSAGMFENEDMDLMAPQGLPTTHDGLTDAFNSQTAVSNTNYGSIAADPQQDAYDRYITSHQ